MFVVQGEPHQLQSTYNFMKPENTRSITDKGLLESIGGGDRDIVLVDMVCQR